MSTPEPQKQAVFAVHVVRALRDAGYEALWAGGCVRDQLLGHTPKDYDVATSALPDQVRELFGRRRTLSVGAAFGVILVLGPRGAGQIDVATFREDDAYSDGRRPDSVTFTSAEHDAQRRDFTINGLFFDPLDRRVIDYVGGQPDLEKRIVRAIGEPRIRFTEDKLRMLRAVRFAATLRFTIEAETLRAIREMAPNIKQVSDERIGEELRRMLLSPNRASALELLRETWLLEALLPEIAPSLETGRAKADADGSPPWRRLLEVCSRLLDPTLPVVLAAVLHIANRPDALVRLTKDLRLSNKEAERTGWLLEHVELIAQATTAPWARLQPVLIHSGAGELLTLYEALTSADDPNVLFCREKLDLQPHELDPPPLLTGEDLIAHGLTPGPKFQALLEQVRTAQLHEEISTRQQALALVDQLSDDEDRAFE